MGEHKTSAKPLIQQTSKTVGKHFIQKGHEVHDMNFVVIEKVRSRNPFILKARESYWINQYNSSRHGLNIAEYFLFWYANFYFLAQFAVSSHLMMNRVYGL